MALIDKRTVVDDSDSIPTGLGGHRVERRIAVPVRSMMWKALDKELRK